MVTLVTLVSYSGAGEAQTEPFVVTVPGRGWQIHLQAPPLNKFAGHIQGDSFVFQAAGAGGFNVSAFVEEPSSNRSGHEACFEHYWPMAKRNPIIDQTSVKIVKSKKYVKVSYLVNPPGQASGKTNRHVNYYFSHEGRWVDVHASQSPARDEEAKSFEDFESGLSYGPAKSIPTTR